jgi:diaminopimelate epimerase
MEIEFHKYQGTGNDFIVLDCRKTPDLKLSDEQIQQLCNRRFGVGADGFIQIFEHDSYNFEMRYFNADGSRSFCGNGARCAVKFAHSLGLFKEKANFLAIDGSHEAEIVQNNVALKMSDVSAWENNQDHFVLDTGSPHYIKFVTELSEHNIVEFGKEIRYSDKYRERGINVNLVETISDTSLSMLTYERGVEDETFSCGTGATAVALAYMLKNKMTGKHDIEIKVKGGNLSVQATKEDSFSNIYLIGPAKSVFHGRVSI